MNRAVTSVLVLVAVLLLSGTALSDDAAALYKSKCAMCHAADGSGATPMGKKLALRDMRSAEVQKMTDEQLIDITSKGKNKMPGFKNKLTADQIKGLVAYVRELAKKK